MSLPIRVLLSNDDGVQSPGLLALKRAFEREGHLVTVCAPDRPRSASGHSITLHKPLRMVKTTLADGSEAWAASGTPTDCATLGLLELMREECDLVVSGINHGPNLGWDVTYSGTVSVAMEAVIAGTPAVAVSMTSYQEIQHWETAANFVAKVLAPKICAEGMPPVTLLNVNVPDLPESEIAGVKLTVQGDRQYVDRVERRLDPLGRPYYWLGGKIHDKETADGTDVHEVGQGYIAVTPIHLDMTAYAFLEDLKTWDIER